MRVSSSSCAFTHVLTLSEHEQNVKNYSIANMAKLSLPKPVVIDFETFGIKGRPFYPPLPVGVSIKYDGKAARYYAWGHLSGNNCSWDEAAKVLKAAWSCPDGMVFQNGKFDVDVANIHFNLPLPDWRKIHDTLLLLFLDDPHQTELGLKEASERLFDLPPDERDDICDWLLEHQPIKGVKISKSKQSDHYYGRYIAYAPGALVGRYANGDTERTEKIFKLLYPKTVEREMLGAYDRERELMPILLDMERQGLPVDHEKLKKDVTFYNEWRDKINTWIIEELNANPNINLDSGEQLINSMIAAGKAAPHLMPKTPTGKYQTNKEALLLGVTDKRLLAVLKYRTQLNTCLNTFMEPWLRVADYSGGLIYTTWNQTKAPKGDGAVGTRTGRLSSTPNFQNIPKEFSPIFAHENPENKKLPPAPLKGIPPLPKIRSYIVPFKGHILIDRDYSQQEPRILAHFDGGELQAQYQKEPWVDFHDYAKQALEQVGLYYDRKPVKNTNLGLIYGMGAPKLAIKNNMTVEEANVLKKAILRLYPGLKEMYAEAKRRSKAKLPMRTWGGREFYCEAPKLVDGRLREFDYKMVNFLIQGSAAECTKEAIIRFYRKKKAEWKLLLNVHDQLTASIPLKERKQAMKVLQECMEGVVFDVPMLSEGAISTTNWDALIDYDKKGVVVYAD